MNFSSLPGPVTGCVETLSDTFTATSFPLLNGTYAGTAIKTTIANGTPNYDDDDAADGAETRGNNNRRDYWQDSYRQHSTDGQRTGTGLTLFRLGNDGEFADGSAEKWSTG